MGVLCPLRRFAEQSFCDALRVHYFSTFCPASSRAKREETGLKKNTTRILSLLLVLMMVVSLFPSAYAAETGEFIEDEDYGSAWEDWDDQPAEEDAPAAL